MRKERRRVPGAAQHERHSASLRAFTPVFDGIWTRVNALMAGDALQTPISGLPEIGAQIRASQASPTCVERYELRALRVPASAVNLPNSLRAAPHPGHTA